MGAKEVTHICGQPLERFEDSIKFRGHSFWFRRDLTEGQWVDFVNFINKTVMDAYNEGVDDTRQSIKEALGIYGS